MSIANPSDAVRHAPAGCPHAHMAERFDPFDISDPFRPVEICALRHPSEGRIEGLAVREFHVFVIVRDEGVHVLDVADPHNPRSLARWQRTNETPRPGLSEGRLIPFEQVAVSGEYAFLAFWIRQ